MTKPYRISENAVTGDAPITIYENSKDLAFLDPRKYRVVGSTNLSNYLSSDLINTETDYINQPGEGNNLQAKDVPQLEDIEVIQNSTYINDRGITRARLVIRVRNSSGKDLLGVDARKAILASEGGQS